MGTTAMVKETILGHIQCWSLLTMNKNFIPILNVISHYTSDRVSNITFGLYQTGFENSGRLPILFVEVTPELQWK